MSLRQIQRSQGGFTLVELLVATTMALIVFAVTLSMLNAFSDTSQALDRRNDSQNEARLGVDQIVSRLRTATSSPSAPSLVERATPYDVVFQMVPVSGGPSELLRYCIPPDPAPGSSASEALIAQTLTPVPSSIPSSASACPAAAFGSSSVAVDHVTNRRLGADRPAFTYDGGSAPSDLTTITSIGIDLFVNPTPSDSHNEYELQSSALLRNALPSPPDTSTVSGS